MPPMLGRRWRSSAGLAAGPEAASDEAGTPGAKRAREEEDLGLFTTDQEEAVAAARATGGGVARRRERVGRGG